jgi:endonuclease-8
MADPPDLDGMLVRLRTGPREREIGDALLDQGLVAGIGNMWRAEALFAANVSPWARLSELDDEDVRRVLEGAAALMRAGRGAHRVYRRAGRPCRVCGAPIRSRPQGDNVRMAYWCPACQAGTRTAGA